MVWVVWKVGHPRERRAKQLMKQKRKTKKKKMKSDKNYDRVCCSGRERFRSVD